MKKLVRKGVFETNSSSCHSLSINYDKKEVFDTLDVDEDGVVRINCGWYNFCRQHPRRTNDTVEKVAFFATLLTRYQDNPNESEDLEDLKEQILENTQASDVEFLDLGRSIIEFSSDFDIPTGRSLYRAIFDKNSWLFIEGDEYSLYDDEDEYEFYHPEEVTE